MADFRSSILFVDDDADLCAIVQDSFLRLGARSCKTVGSLREMQEMGRDLFSYDLAVLDINLGAGEPNGVEAFYWLEDQDFKGRVVFLTGHAHDDPRVVTAAAITGTLVLSKPVKTQDLERLLKGGAR